MKNLKKKFLMKLEIFTNLKNDVAIFILWIFKNPATFLTREKRLKVKSWVIRIFDFSDLDVF